MLRQSLLLLLVIMVGAAATEARKKGKRAGTIKDKVFSDSNYGIQLSLPSEWTADVHKDDDFYRLTIRRPEVLEEKKKANYSAFDEWTARKWLRSPAVPLIDIWIVETAYEPEDVLDTMVSNDSESAWKKRMLFILGHPEEALVFRKINQGSLAGIPDIDPPALCWVGSFQYFAPSMNSLKVKMPVAATCMEIKPGLKLVMVMRSNREWFELTKDASNAIFASATLIKR